MMAAICWWLGNRTFLFLTQCSVSALWLLLAVGLVAATLVYQY